MGWCKYRIFIAILTAVSITAGGLLGFHKPLLKGCLMTYMYPTYIPVPLPSNAISGKYSLYLYHEGWKKIDYQLHLVKLSGVPVLFIPGNGGSYKQVSFPIEIKFLVLSFGDCPLISSHKVWILEIILITLDCFRSSGTLTKGSFKQLKVDTRV